MKHIAQVKHFENKIYRFRSKLWIRRPSQPCSLTLLLSEPVPLDFGLTQKFLWRKWNQNKQKLSRFFILKQFWFWTKWTNHVSSSCGHKNWIQSGNSMCNARMSTVFRRYECVCVRRGSHSIGIPFRTHHKRKAYLSFPCDIPSVAWDSALTETICHIDYSRIAGRCAFDDVISIGD